LLLSRSGLYYAAPAGITPRRVRIRDDGLRPVERRHFSKLQSGSHWAIRSQAKAPSLAAPKCLRTTVHTREGVDFAEATGHPA